MVADVVLLAMVHHLVVLIVQAPALLAVQDAINLVLLAVDKIVLVLQVHKF